MQPIPIAVKNVNVYPYIPVGPIGPAVQAVIEDAEGTYSVGTLITQVFYNLDLHGGERKDRLQVNGTYYAVATNEQNQTFQTHWMYCLSASEKPTFGLTQNSLQGVGGDDTHLHLHLGGARATAEAAPMGPVVQNSYITIAELEEVNVSQSFPPPAIGQIELISGAKGQLIATRTGTPHLTGFRVEGGDRTGHLYAGMKDITVSGRRVDNGEVVGLQNLSCVVPGDPAIFLQSFPATQEGQSNVHIHIHR